MSRRVPDGTTRLCGVIGHPVAHSLSPVIHSAALEHDGINGVYVALDVDPGNVRAAIAGLAALSAVGVNVTLPHKLAALDAATRRSEEAEMIGAANTLVFSGGQTAAYNTDAEGIRRALEDLEVDPKGARCLVLGAGGAARAVVSALASGGAADIAVSNRTHGRAQELALRVQDLGLTGSVVPWESVGDEVGSRHIVVHSTSVGMDGRAAPLGDDVWPRASGGSLRAVLDLVYAPGETAIVRAARAAGIKAVDGLGVLVHQAAVSYGLFWDASPPLAVMREAAERAAGR